MLATTTTGAAASLLAALLEAAAVTLWWQRMWDTRAQLLVCLLSVELGVWFVLPLISCA